MNAYQEKAAWVLLPPQTAIKNAPAEFTPDQKLLAGVEREKKGLMSARKRLMNSGELWARAARLGWAVERLEGAYRLTKVNCSVCCPNLETVAHLLLDDGS